MEVERQKVTRDMETGDTTVVETRDQIPSRQAVREVKAHKTNSYIWYIVGLIEALLVLRILFLAFGARAAGFTDVLYALTAPLAAPFRGIFPAPAIDGAYFDTASLVAMVIYYLIGWGIASLIDVAKQPESPADLH